MNNKILDNIALTLVVIGAINWGLIGFFNFNLVNIILGSIVWLERVVYAVVGLCGLYLITFYAYINSQN